MSKEFLSEVEIAELLNLSIAKLRRDRWLGNGLPFIRIGRTVRYSREQITKYFELNTVNFSK